MQTATKIIYLQDFYDENKFYKLDLQKKSIEPTSRAINSSDINGYSATEQCGIRRDREIHIGYFSLEKRDFLICQNQIICFDEKKLNIKKIIIIPFFLEKIVISIDHDPVLNCLHWIVQEDAYSTNIFQIILSIYHKTHQQNLKPDS